MNNLATFMLSNLSKILIFFLPIVGFGQIKFSTIENSKIPKSIIYSGEVKTAIEWTDNLGYNLVIQTESDETQSKGDLSDAYRDASLNAYHYIKSGDSLKLVWKIYDFIKKCPMDINANFVKNTLQITDLNKNGVGEIWIIYKVCCRGDISPCNMKIIMYQGQQKYAMRGQNKVELPENKFYGGEYKYDDSFKNDPKEFKDFALSLWNKNVLETWVK